MQVSGLSIKVERALSQLTAGALNYDGGGGSTKPGRFTGVEICGGFAMGEPGKKESRAAFLALLIAAGAQRTGDEKMLSALIIEVVLVRHDWFEVRRFIKDKAYREKVRAMVDAAVGISGRDDRNLSSQTAGMMGISRQAFNRTWASRQRLVQKQISDWIEQAAMACQKNI